MTLAYNSQSSESINRSVAQTRVIVIVETWKKTSQHLAHLINDKFLPTEKNIWCFLIYSIFL